MAETKNNQLNSDELKVINSLLEVQDSFEFNVGSKSINILLGSGDIGANFINVRNDLIKDYLKDILLDQFKDKLINGLDKILVNNKPIDEYLESHIANDVSMGDIFRDDDDMDIAGDTPMSDVGSANFRHSSVSSNLVDSGAKVDSKQGNVASAASLSGNDAQGAQIVFDPAELVKAPARLLGDVVSLPFKSSANVISKISSWRDGTPNASIEAAVRHSEALQKAIDLFKATPKVSELMDELNNTGDMTRLSKLIQDDPEVRHLWRNANNALGSVSSLWRKAARANAREGKDITELSDEHLDRIKKIAKNIPHKFDMNGAVKSTFAETLQTLMDRIANIIKALFKKKNGMSQSLS